MKLHFNNDKILELLSPILCSVKGTLTSTLSPAIKQLRASSKSVERDATESEPEVYHADKKTTVRGVRGRRRDGARIYLLSPFLFFFSFNKRYEVRNL